MHSQYLIPSTGETKKSQTKSTDFECYSLGGIDDKVQLIIRPIHTEKANYEVHGTYLYRINNLSHFEVDIEINFKNSLNINTKENNNFEPNKILFRKHIEPFQNLDLTNNKSKTNDDENGICIVQYNKGYLIRANIKCTFTYPTPEKQRSFVVVDHKEILENLDKWKTKYKPSYIEQMILFNPKKPFESLFDFSEVDATNGNNRKTKFHNVKINKMNNKNTENTEKTIYFVDEEFPPCKVDQYTIDLSKEIKTNPLFSNTELDKDKLKTVIFHYRAIENLLPDKTAIYTSSEEFSPYDITCGLIKNHNIISVFAHLAQTPHYLRQLIPDNSFNKMGIYKVRLFLMNGWTSVFVDKFIPCFPCYFPIYTYSTKSLWPVLLEKALAKSFDGYEKLTKLSYFDLYTVLLGMPVMNCKRIEDKYYVNTNYKNTNSETLTKEQIIDMINTKNYLVAVYASDEFAEANYNSEQKKDLYGKVFPVVGSDFNSLQIKTIYYLQLKKYANYTPQDTDVLELPWSAYSTLFDNVILIQNSITHSISLRNGFIRCLDDDAESELEATLAHTYYEFALVKKNREIPGPFNITVVLTLANDHFLDNSYFSPEIDWRIGVLKLQKNPNKKKVKEYSSEDPLKGRSVKIINTIQYTIGYCLVLNLSLEEGEYIIAPMTQGDLMKPSSNISFKSYNLKDSDNKSIPINQTIISKFLDDLFYMNDPFNNNFVEYPAVKKISENIIDNSGKKNKPIEEKAFKEYSYNCKDSNNGKTGLSKLLFKDFMYEKMNLIDENKKKATMLNLGYNINTFPYMGRFFGFSIYFGNTDNLDIESFHLKPFNNIIDNNIPYIISRCEEIMKK